MIEYFVFSHEEGFAVSENDSCWSMFVKAESREQLFDKVCDAIKDKWDVDSIEYSVFFAVESSKVKRLSLKVQTKIDVEVKNV